MERKTLEKLTDYYFKVMYSNAKNVDNKPGWRERVEFALEELEEKGFSALEIFDKLTELKGSNRSRAIEPDKLFTEAEMAAKNNLLEPGKEYFHRELKVYHDDIPFGWPTNKEFYSAEDLLSFFYKVCNVECPNRDNDRKLLKHLLDRYGIDEILFTISGIIPCEDHDPVYNINIIYRFIDRGIEFYHSSRDLQIELKYQNERNKREWEHESHGR